MGKIQNHVLVADIGGTHTGIAIFASLGNDLLEPVCHRTFRTTRIGNMPKFFTRFLKKEGSRLDPPVRRACIDFAGPIPPARNRAQLTNLPLTFTDAEVRNAAGLEKVVLLNDFEAIGYGIEVLIRNRPEAFVRLSRNGKLPSLSGVKPTAAILGAGTGLGTTVLIHDTTTGKYHPIPGEGGHVDFSPVDEIEYRITDWLRKNRNTSSSNPLNRERIVSGPGLANVHEALASLEPKLGSAGYRKAVFRAKATERPAIIAGNASNDSLCRKAFDIWLRCYGRAAKNSAIFPLAPGGVFLAGGVAAKNLPEMKSGTFMKEFHRCDIPNIRELLRKTPVFVVTDYRIGLYGCANVAANDLI